MTVGERIKARRKELHMTLDDVSRETGIPKSTIQRWESGAITNMGQDRLRKAAEALKTTVSFLQTGVSVEITHFPKKTLLPDEVFHYLCKKSGYSYSSHIGTDRYYDNKNKNNFELVCVNNNVIQEVMDLVIPYFGYLMHQRAIPLQDFMKLMANQQENNPDPADESN